MSTQAGVFLALAFLFFLIGLPLLAFLFLFLAIVTWTA
jgi:hypothetical protein